MKGPFETKDDQNLSPYTGWTRERWIELAEIMIGAIQPYVTPGKGGLALPNPVRWMDAFLPEPEKMETFYWLEGYTRTRALIASWLVGTGKTELTVNGKTVNILDQFTEGLLSVSDPSHLEFIGDRYGNNQWIAETSAVALAIYLTRELIWEQLSRKEQQQISSWLRAATGHKIPDNNWYTFIANTHYVLKALGEKYDQDELNHCIRRVKDFYIGKGWFMDGDKSRGYSVEQYNAWGFHYFLPAYVYMGGVDSELKDWIIERLQQFLISYERFFGANGSIAMWGRSWAYRPALTVPFIWAELLGVSPLPSGETRRIVSGQMKFYLDNGYFYDNLTPTMGYLGENLELIDPYSQYGSPYWGSGIFFCLLMSKTHPFWKEKEKPLLVERESYCCAEEPIGMLIAGNHETGEVQIINHRAWHQKEGPGTKYAKKYTTFCYSTNFGIDLRRTENGYNCDNMFSVSPDGKKYSQRIIPYFIRLDENYGASYHYPLTGFPFVDHENINTFSADAKIEVKEDRSVKVTTQTYLKDFCQIRIHTVDTDQELMSIREGGFALNYFDQRPESIVSDNSIGFWDGKRGSFILSLAGFARPEKIEKLFGCTENFNTLGGFSVIPTLIGEKLRPGKHVFISMSGTWFVYKEGIEKLLDLVTHVDVKEDQIILFFVDKTKYVFYV